MYNWNADTSCCIFDHTSRGQQKSAKRWVKGAAMLRLVCLSANCRDILKHEKSCKLAKIVVLNSIAETDFKEKLFLLQVSF